MRAGVSRRRGASRTRLSTAALLLLAGCASASLSDPSFPVVPGVQAIESNIVMSAIKDTTALPLELAEPTAESQDGRRARDSDARP